MASLGHTLGLARHGLQPRRRCRAREALGPDVEITISAVDECNTRIRPNKIIQEFAKWLFRPRRARQGTVEPVSPRARHRSTASGRRFPVVIGGFHVSGCLAMLPEVQSDLKAALGIGATLFAGDSRGVSLPLNDAAAGQSKPIYRFLDDVPGLRFAAPVCLPVSCAASRHHTSFDAGRGCPFQCSFCTIIDVQGRRSRRRSPDDVEVLIRLEGSGIRHFVITDDNFARNKDWTDPRSHHRAARDGQA